MYTRPRLTSHAGIAIGPILMVIALLAVIAGVMAAGSGTFSSNASVDRIRTEVRGQANLIRAKIQECYMVTMGNLNFGYPIGSGVLVRNLNCPGDPTGDQNLWTGARETDLPPAVPGFDEWVYYNYASGRCISIKPTSSTPPLAIRDGLTILSGLFSVNERHLDTAGDWTLSIWLTPLTTTKKCGT